jgi:flagellar basal-body rod modification protein FlgD
MNGVGAINQLPVFGDANATLAAPATDKEDFLNLLVAQMKYQDPMNPLEGTEFAAQLAQFSSVEELRNIGSKMDSQTETNLLLAQSVNNTMATTLIGKSVRAADNTLVFNGSSPVDLNYNLAGLASPVNFTIASEDGVTIRNLSVPNAAKGDNKIAWDGKDGRGNRVPPGNYYFEVTATAPGGASVVAMPLTIGRIGGVRFENGSPVLLLNGRSIPFGSVLEILEDTTSNSSVLSRLMELGN